MNPRVTGLLFLAAAALGAFVWFYEIRGEEGRLAEEAESKRLFPGFEAADVASIALTAADGTPVRLERVDGGWTVVAPLAFPADDFAVDAMASALAELDGGTLIEDPQPLAVYGLDDDTGAVRFDAGGDELELRIGDSAPVGSRTYVMKAGSGEVRTVPSHRVNVFDKRFADLRDRRPLHFDPDAVDHVEVSWPGGGVVLDRGEEGWQLTSPVARPADADAVAGLLQDLTTLRADGFVDEPPADADAGLDAPAFAVRLRGGGGAGAPEEFEATLAIGGREDADSHLARAGEKSLYRIASDRLADFPTSVSAYRFKQLSEFDALAADRIDLVFHTAAGETVPMTATRGESGWSSDPEPFAPGKLATLAGNLANLRAEDVLADSMGPAELAGLGLSPANAVYRVYGEPPADAGEAGAAAEAPLLAEIHVGNLRGSDGVVARRAGDDTVYLLGIERSEYIPISYEAFGNHFRADASGEAEAAAGADAPPPEAPQ